VLQFWHSAKKLPLSSASERTRQRGWQRGPLVFPLSSARQSGTRQRSSLCRVPACGSRYRGCRGGPLKPSLPSARPADTRQSLRHGRLSSSRRIFFAEHQVVLGPDIVLSTKKSLLMYSLLRPLSECHTRQIFRLYRMLAALSTTVCSSSAHTNVGDILIF
jgi:hypothetical protein